MGRFHNYSFGNILEIARQKPDATRVAGLYAWNQLGRKVRKGERGIRILAPVIGVRRKKDAEAEKRFGELRVKTLEDSVAHQQSQIAALEKQLADAKQQVQDIAVKAIEGASGARALSHINQIAMEQAKNRPQG